MKSKSPAARRSPDRSSSSLRRSPGSATNAAPATEPTHRLLVAFDLPESAVATHANQWGLVEQLRQVGRAPHMVPGWAAEALKAVLPHYAGAWLVSAPDLLQERAQPGRGCATR